MTTMAPETAPVAGMGIPFVVASRPQKRFANVQTVSNISAAGSFQIVQLAATGWVRRVSLLFTAATTQSAGGAVVAGDAPFNLVSNITLSDATGQPVQQPISGYSQYLVNKHFSSGGIYTNMPRAWGNPQMGPEFDYAVQGAATTSSAKFRLNIDHEQDAGNGYGCIPNLDSNASLQLKVDYAAASVAFAGTLTAATLSMRVEQEYWAPVGSSIGGAPVATAPPGAGDYIETRYETQTVSASSENLVNLTNRGGLIKGIILVSRAAGVRTAITATSNLGILLDNQPINEGVPIESHLDQVRREYGYLGADLTTSYAPLTSGVLPGLDRGVVPINFEALAGGRTSWLNTRAGSLLQVKVFPGASATTLEIITLLAQVKDMAAFYNVGDV